MFPLTRLMEALLSQRDCCTHTCPEDSQIITNLPGPPGQDGEDGQDGATGLNAYTALATEFTVPEANKDVTINVGNTAWMVPRQSTVPGQIIVIQYAGHYEVRSIVDITHAVVRNLNYPGNAPEGAVIPIGARIGPGGLQGQTGSAQTGVYFQITEDLREGDAPEIRNTLGIGTAGLATQGNLKNNIPWVTEDPGLTTGRAVFATAGGLETKTPALAQTALGLGTMATQNANAVAITGGGIANLVPPLEIASGGTGQSTLAGIKGMLGVMPGYGLLASWDVNFNATNTDFPVDITVTPLRYRIDRMTLQNAQGGSLAGAMTLGLYTGAAGSGPISSTPSLNNLTGPNKYLDIPILGDDVRTESRLYARTGSTGTAAVTVNVRLYGWVFA